MDSGETANRPALAVKAPDARIKGLNVLVKNVFVILGS